MKNLLLINAHQLYETISPGRLNRSLAGIIKEDMEKRGYKVRQTDIESGYDTDTEVQNHVWADLIILQAPVFWFGAPWIYKKYVDEVFSAGLSQKRLLTGDGRTRENPSKQYGTGGLMQGKKYMLSLTWNAPREAFDDKDQVLFTGKTVDDVFVANTANYTFCGAEILPSFSCYDVMKAPDIESDIARLREHLAAISGCTP
ncbi:NAD(P)H-dependent oxidoreductase [Xylella taiwanensis]|uniref:Flavodoxin n=1 Tax=Xylella taiwanensis TaxID=1444770 RepID=Z9JLT5_9GAMM|nr:NAD(P)H-dependent oxidoreductase [Xylella taiwanensis]AXI84474.1 flavodoxin [Xylella taiwanensis]EWS79375.1 flavodoxin [Xylella taiwanensis]MCD8455371.1 NAD(P)H-dependent oxidoreductase [Xylella taiwanensis]MCD8457775.1 NAD(P)H-dependent oxidoreductase [Xylella taiwanensis]MCD8459910.1 NAD(P)H-dependent oxidoreductase [Xylella taiwanensis]